MKVIRLFSKIFIWSLLIAFIANYFMRAISYSFYKGDKQKENLKVYPRKLTYKEGLTGYSYNSDKYSDSIILCFGGSFYIAYNTVGIFAPYYDVPFLAVDYYGTQDSEGKMDLQSMQASAEGLYDWAVNEFPGRKVIIVGHSYGCGMAAYLASVRKCDRLFMAAGYRDLSDLYNKILPIFWGPLKLFISDNINPAEYAKETSCPVTIIGSEADKTLSSRLQKKLADCYGTAELYIFPDIDHEAYLTDERVINLIQKAFE